MTRGQRNYHAFTRAVKTEYGLSHKQAIVAYRAVAERLERQPTGKDVRAHPRIVREEAQRAPARERAIRAARTRAAKAAPPPAIAPPPARVRPPAPPPPVPAIAPPPPPAVPIIPEEFIGIEDFVGGEEFDEEAEY